MNTKKTRFFLFIFVLMCVFLLTSISVLATDSINLEYKAVHIVKAGDNLFTIALTYDVTLDDIIELNNIENPDLIYPDQEIYIPYDTSNFLGGGWTFTPVDIQGYWESTETVDDYVFVDDNDTVGVWKNTGVCSEINSFDSNIEQQLTYMDNNPTFKLSFAEYGDIKNGGNFVWSSGTFYNYTSPACNSSYSIRLMGSYKYMFLEYNKNNDIFSGIEPTSNDIKYYVFRKYENVYIVHPGDTLNKIALAFGTSAETIAEINDISDINRIDVFQKLIMPNN